MLYVTLFSNNMDSVFENLVSKIMGDIMYRPLIIIIMIVIVLLGSGSRFYTACESLCRVFLTHLSQVNQYVHHYSQLPGSAAVASTPDTLQPLISKSLVSAVIKIANRNLKINVKYKK